MNYFRIIFFALFANLIWASANADNFKDEKYVQITKHDFKDYLETGKVLEVYQTNEGSILGKYRGGDSKTYEFTVKQWDHSNPFIAEAVKKKGLAFERKPIQKVYETYVSAYNYVSYVLIAIFVVFTIINIYIAIKIRKLYKLAAQNTKE